MQNEKRVNFDYFFLIFRKEFNILATKHMIKSYGLEIFNEMTEFADPFATFPIPSIRLEFYNRALIKTGNIYCKLTQTKIKEPKLNALEYMMQILETIKEGLHIKEFDGTLSYPEAFLWALEMICREYFIVMEKGEATLVNATNPKKEKNYEIVLNDNNQIIKCEATNMDMKESAQTLLHVLKLEKKNQQGPVQNVVYKYDKNIY